MSTENTLNTEGFLKKRNIDDLEISDDLSDSDDFEDRSVTQIDDNMTFHSITISKEGKNIASIVKTFQATSLDGASGFQVSGQLAGLTGGKGQLELVWSHPGSAEAAN